jgi:hypothetical protein
MACLGVSIPNAEHAVFRAPAEDVSREMTALMDALQQRDANAYREAWNKLWRISERLLWDNSCRSLAASRTAATLRKQSLTISNHTARSIGPTMWSDAVTVKAASLPT